MGVRGFRHRRRGFLQVKSQLSGSSYHVYLAFGGQGGKLDVGAAGLGGLIRGQEPSSVDQAETAQERQVGSGYW